MKPDHQHQPLLVNQNKIGIDSFVEGPPSDKNNKSVEYKISTIDVLQIGMIKTYDLLHGNEIGQLYCDVCQNKKIDILDMTFLKLFICCLKLMCYELVQ